MELLGRGDPRVEARSVELFERIVSTGSLVLKTIGGTRSGEVAVQRLLSSPRLSVDTIIEASSMRTVRACAGRRVVCAQDTSEINFARWAGRKGLGPGGDGKTPGFFVHPIVAVDAEEEAVLGLVGARIWTRGSARSGFCALLPRPSRTRLSWNWAWWKSPNSNHPQRVLSLCCGGC